jgi:hypothetical protein
MAIIVGFGSSAVRTPLSAQLSANFRGKTEAAFAASEMCGTSFSAAGFLFAKYFSLHTKLQLAAVLCVPGFGAYFVEAAKLYDPQVLKVETYRCVCPSNGYKHSGRSIYQMQVVDPKHRYKAFNTHLACC